jgi:succinate dehydrogenase / fumarate reductase membrane anchor subunit
MSRAAQGLRAWLLQRFTAIYIAVYVLVAGWYLLSTDTLNYTAWRNWFGQSWISVATVVFAAAALLHAWVGIRDVLIDYVHAVWLRLLFMAITALVLLGSLLWVMRALTLAAIPGAG